MNRALPALLALMLSANGLVMLAASRWWYGAVPGVVMTGPFNPHFVKDIGAAYLVCGAAFAWRASGRSGGFGAAAAAAGFVTLHALIHVADAFAMRDALQAFTRDLVGIYLIAALALWAAWPRKGDADASRPALAPDHPLRTRPEL
jgi:hypothetical protein